MTTITNSGSKEKFSLRYDQTLKIRIEQEPVSGHAWVILEPPGPPLRFSDLTMTVDILDWDEGARGLSAGMAFRMRKVDVKNITLAGVISLRDRDAPFVKITTGNNWNPDELCAIDPEKRYRLVFAVIGHGGTSPPF